MHSNNPKQNPVILKIKWMVEILPSDMGARAGAGIHKFRQASYTKIAIQFIYKVHHSVPETNSQSSFATMTTLMNL